MSCEPQEGNLMTQYQLIEYDDISAFLFAGDALFTLINTHTQNRFTFNITKAKRAYRLQNGRKISIDRWFVKLLTGPDNLNSYTYMGKIERNGGYEFFLTQKSLVTEHAQSVRVLRWFLNTIERRNLPPSVHIYHEGRCGRCGRTLTVPESIIRGLGPECRKKTQLAA